MSEHTPESIVPFVSRKAELQKLHQVLRLTISTKKPKFMLIQGDFGVGKTVLVKHFLAEVLAQNPSFLIGEGKCAMETELNGLIPFSRLLSSLVAQAIQQGTVVGDLLDFVKSFAPAWADVIVTSRVQKDISFGREIDIGGGAYIGENVNTAGGDFVGRDKIVIFQGHSTFSQEQVFVQFTNALTRLAEKQPIIALIEDLHWADASSLHLLFHLARNLEEGAMLFIGTYRPVAATITGRNAESFNEIYSDLDAIEVELNQGINVAMYVAQRYPLTYSSFPEALISRVQKVTDGHALFVSQLFELWEKTGVIISTQNSDGQLEWRLADNTNASIPIPPKIDKVLQQRIRLMEEELREVLICASVEGEDFTAQVIARLRQLDELGMFNNLEILEQGYRFIQAKAIKDVDPTTVLSFYRFAHPFFREHIYNHLSEGKRVLLHRQVGECLEVLYKDSPNELAGQLAFHFREARLPLKAARYALLAAQFEQSRYAWAEAEQWCEFGLILVDKPSSNSETQQIRLDLIELLAKGYVAIGNYPQAYDKYQIALTLAQQEDSPVRVANIYAELSSIADSENDMEEALQFVNQGKRILNNAAIPLGEVYSNLDMCYGMVQIRLGNVTLAAESLHKVLNNTDKLPQTRRRDWIISATYSWLGVALAYLNDYSGSTAAHQKAIEIANQIGDKQLATSSLITLADDYADQGNLREAEAAVTEGLKIAHQIGDLDNEAYARRVLGFVFLECEKPQEAIVELTQALTVSERINAQWNKPFILGYLALAYIALPDLKKAYEYAVQSLTDAQKGAQLGDLAFAHEVAARVEAALQNWESTTEHFVESIDHYQKSESQFYATKTQRHFAKALLQQGGEQQKARAIDLLHTALATFEELGQAHEIAETQRMLNTMSELL